MAVDLLLVLLLHAKEDLRGYDALVGVSEVQVRVEPEGGGVFEEVGGDWFVVESRLHVGTGLVDSEEGEYVQDPGMYFPPAICDDADYDLKLVLDGILCR